MTIAILTLGTELTRGDLVDKNGCYLARELTALGHEVIEIATIDDHDQRIIDALRRLAQVSDCVICTGGLGPTTDDRTAACAAAAAHLPLKRDPTTQAKIEAMLTERGREANASSLKQSDFPQSATILANEKGTAPGFSMLLGTTPCYFLPGVPGEMRAMFAAEVVPLLPAPAKTNVCLRLQTFGVFESEINERLGGLEAAEDVTIGYRAHLGGVEIKVQKSGEPAAGRGDVTEQALATVARIKSTLGEAIYAEGETTLAETLGSLLTTRGYSLALAESCTGGLVSQLITQVPGASDYYLGGVVSYANSAKADVLGVPAELLVNFGAVSDAVVQAMAEGARRIFQADISLAISGIAGPGGGTSEKPVGLVYWAVCTKDSTQIHSQIFRGSRSEIQERAALCGLWSVYQTLRSTSP